MVAGFTGPIGQVTANLYLTHTYDSDLAISLIAPDSTVVTLSNSRGGSGDNYGSSCSPDSSRTTFDEMVRLDIRYARTCSLSNDLKILLATPAAVIAGKGAC